MNQEIRQKALRGEWLPKLNDLFCSLNRITGAEENNLVARFSYTESEVFAFFPDEQTRTEYLQVAEGTWLPKAGDMWCAVQKSSLIYDGLFNSLDKPCPFAQDNLSFAYFPSAEQRSAFIAKRKGEEPNKSKPEERIFKGQVEEFLKSNGLAKPQTIEICISEEAIDKAAKILSDAVLYNEKDGKAVAIVRSVVGALHLEATLAK